MNSDERVSNDVSGESQSTDSYGRTDGLTETSPTPIDQSLTYAPHTRIQADQELLDEWRRYAPAEVDPATLSQAILGFFDAWDEAAVRQPLIRTGSRTPLCWHLRSMVKRRDNWRCRWCGATADRQELQLDHLTPWSAGGPQDTRNLQVLCEPCNAIKTNTVDPGRTHAPGVVIRCLRCRDVDVPPRGDLVWCFNCQTFSHETTAWVNLGQLFLATHCDEILRPEHWSREVAAFERMKLLDAWEEWAPPAAAKYERELRDSLRELILDYRAHLRGLPPVPDVTE